MDRTLIPIVLFQVAGIVALAFSPIGQALARRIGGTRVDARELEELKADVSDLRAELDDVRSRAAQLEEMQERLDFAERMLAQGKKNG